jgi:hypothetical protein
MQIDVPDALTRSGSPPIFPIPSPGTEATTLVPPEVPRFGEIDINFGSKLVPFATTAWFVGRPAAKKSYIPVRFMLVELLIS